MNASFDSEGVQFVWDSTSIKRAKTCLRKYQYEALEGWTPRKEALNLRFGKHYATALEHYFKHIHIDKIDPEEALRRVVLEALTDTWDECDECHGKGYRTETNICLKCGGLCAQPWNSMDANKNRETLVRSIVWYFEQFEDDAMPLHVLPDGTPAVEYSFKLPVDNGIILSGHIDRLVNYSGGLYVSDQKTTKYTIGPYYFEQYSPDDQVSAYSFAARAIWQVPIKGVVIDAAQIAVGFTRFERSPILRTDQVLDEWYEGTMNYIAEVQAHTRAGYFPMRETSCGMYGGCPFREVCARSPEVRPNFLAANFIRGPRWDPAQSR